MVNGRLSSEDFKAIQAALGMTNKVMGETLGVSLKLVESMRSGDRVVTPWTQKLLTFIVKSRGMVF